MTEHPKMRYSRQLEQQIGDLKVELRSLTYQVGHFIEGQHTLSELKNAAEHAQHFLIRLESVVLAEEPKDEHPFDEAGNKTRNFCATCGQSRRICISPQDKATS